MNFSKAILTVLLCLAYGLCFAQSSDSTFISVPDDRSLLDIDTLSPPSDTLVSKVASANEILLERVSLSKDSFEFEMIYSSDSMVHDMKTEKTYMFKKDSKRPKIEYGTITLEADYIEMDIATNTVIATGSEDADGNSVGNPVFQDGTQQFSARKIRYNFDTGVGYVYDVRTTQDDLYLQGSKTKYVSASNDTIHRRDYVYNEDAVFTTCDHPEPHFGIRSKKQKKIGNKMIVAGPSNLEIEGIPTPIWLPFAFFPIPKGRQTGLIFPKSYEFSEQLGFGLRNVGYYFPISDHFDLKLTGDIYLRGTWGLYAQANYRRRYKHTGRLNLSYSDRKFETAGSTETTKQKSFSIQWSHNQDAKAHPTNKFSGSVNIQTNNFQSFNRNDANSVLQNTLSSNLSFNKIFPGKPITLSVYLSHSQNNLTRDVNISMPNVDFRTQTIFPFKRKNAPPGKEKWFEKLSMKYNFKMRNQITAKDTTIFEQETLDNMKFGIQQDIQAGISFKILNYINVNPNINYSEVWDFNTIRKNFDPTNIISIDTTSNPADTTVVSYGQVEQTNSLGFEPARLYTVGISMNTQFFGTMNFKKGKIRGIRHIVKPSISFNYVPDYTREELGYFRTVDTDNRVIENDPLLYSIFESSPFSRPSSAGKQMSLSYSVNNILEAKVFEAKDSTNKIIKLFQNITAGGSYNFAADSLKFSPISVNGTTRLFKELSTLQLSGWSWDIYNVNDNDQRINTTYKKATGKLLRFMGGSIALRTSFKISQIKKLFGSQQKDKEEEEEEFVENEFGFYENPDDELEDLNDPFDTENSEVSKMRERREKNKNRDKSNSFASWFDDFKIDHNVRWNAAVRNNKTTTEITSNSLSLSGNIELSNNWNIRIRSIGYDFKNKTLTYPHVSFTRDLHCWEMGMDWQPQRGTYEFYLRVRPGTLDFIEIPQTRNNVDGRFSGF